VRYNIITFNYDTIEEFNVDWKAEYSALSSTHVAETKTNNANYARSRWNK